MQNFVNVRTRESHDNKYQTAHARTSHGRGAGIQFNDKYNGVVQLYMGRSEPYQ